jgi:RNA polymerase sigma-70 factor (ECF subfamily)
MLPVIPRTEYAEREERTLVMEAQAGNRVAFEELVRRFDREVLRVALHLTKRPEDACDVYQEAFLKLYRNLHRFRSECSFRTWLRRIVTNVCVDHLRRRRAHREEQASDIHVERQEEGTGDFFEFQREYRPTFDPERQLAGKEIRSRIARAMHRLSPRERKVFRLRHNQGLKIRAIGNTLGSSEEAAKNWLYRGTHKMRQELADLR